MRRRGASGSAAERHAILVFAGCRHTTQHAADARQKLAQFVRLHDIIVGADLETDDAVDRGAGGGCEDDAYRHLRTQPAGKREPVLARHGDIQDGELEDLVLGQLAHGSGVSDGRHVEAVCNEIFDDGVPKIGLVLDNDNPRAQCGLASAFSGK